MWPTRCCAGTGDASAWDSDAWLDTMPDQVEAADPQELLDTLPELGLGDVDLLLDTVLDVDVNGQLVPVCFKGGICGDCSKSSSTLLAPLERVWNEDVALRWADTVGPVGRRRPCHRSWTMNGLLRAACES
jgi:hypothetical protein